MNRTRCLVYDINRLNPRHITVTVSESNNAMMNFFIHIHQKASQSGVTAPHPIG
ncbi:hypothetical protein [Endozoicomonas euniceicola]|uniref:Uncharacterized protein n=1 Tax=Endozoicomonas euniceicola TaxID=1234143 RepID=A0ABY6GWB0_9GAMM|nr:hypothetical protein [Endozoicomonas euniceicola]UYM17045.1 hypothetical protein NX720_03710 [Endozoicomonas euniceicola]